MVYERKPWRDRFNQPTPSELRAGLPAPVVELFDEARRILRRIDGVMETVGWYGSSWRWSIEYRLRRQDDPLVVLVPSPEDFQLAMPLERTFVESLPTHRMKRAIRDGLELAQEPFDTRWGVWSVQYPTLLEDLRSLVTRRLDHLESAKSSKRR